MDEHYKVMITRLGTRLRVAGIAEIGGFDISISGPATVLRSLSELFPQAARAPGASAAKAWAGASHDAGRAALSRRHRRRQPVR